MMYVSIQYMIYIYFGEHTTNGMYMIYACLLNISCILCIKYIMYKKNAHFFCKFFLENMKKMCLIYFSCVYLEHTSRLYIHFVCIRMCVYVQKDVFGMSAYCLVRILRTLSD